MSWILTLERRFGHLAIPGLIRYVVFLNAFVWILMHVRSHFIFALVLDRDLVLQGQVWRLVSYIFIPPNVSAIWIAFALLFLWMLGEGLERAWGSFRLTLFYLVGMIGTTIAAFLEPGPTTGAFLNLSLLFAFATIYPEHIIYLFLILPVKMKWLGWFSFVLLAWTFLVGEMALRAAILASFANYLLFFGRDLWNLAKHRREVAERRRKFADAAMAESEALHECAVCKRTELSDPDLDFRVAGDGEEYCVEHLPARSVEA